MIFNQRLTENTLKQMICTKVSISIYIYNLYNNILHRLNTFVSIYFFVFRYGSSQYGTDKTLKRMYYVYRLLNYPLIKKINDLIHLQ